MSSLIGKEPAEVFSNQRAANQASGAVEAQRKTAEAVDKDVRAARFLAALGRESAPPPPPPGQRAVAQAGADKAREASSQRPSGQRPEGANKPGSQQAGELRGEKELSLEDQALLASLAGPHGTGRKGKPQQGQGDGMGPDDMLAGGAASAGGLAGKDRKMKTPGEEAIAEVAAAVSAAAQLPGGGNWSRPEGPAQAAPRAQRELPQPLPGVDPVHQLLIGKGPNGAEAKMIIAVGPLAGTTINLREGPNGLEAQILTQTASSRQTLSSAMQAVAQRLKDKGHKLDVRFNNTSPTSSFREQPARSDQERPRR